MYHVITYIYTVIVTRFCYNRWIQASEKGSFILECTVPFDERFGSSKIARKRSNSPYHVFVNTFKRFYRRIQVLNIGEQLHIGIVCFIEHDVPSDAYQKEPYIYSSIH